MFVERITSQHPAGHTVAQQDYILANRWRNIMLKKVATPSSSSGGMSRYSDTASRLSSETPALVFLDDFQRFQTYGLGIGIVRFLVLYLLDLLRG